MISEENHFYVISLFWRSLFSCCQSLFFSNRRFLKLKLFSKVITKGLKTKSAKLNHQILHRFVEFDRFFNPPKKKRWIIECCLPIIFSAPITFNCFSTLPRNDILFCSTHSKCLHTSFTVLYFFSLSRSVSTNKV